MVVVGLTVQNKRGRNCQHTPLAGVSSAVSLTMTRVKVARIASLKSRLKHASSISCEHHEVPFWLINYVAHLRVSIHEERQTLDLVAK